ncbi:Anthranilate phosphoribosyltransferase [Desulfurella amilsii]|uniref:Anthranilate phosphoribosyltransferase n=1 Tax=Desulfurella amilsii TaxID=1562698 RepID=A0A1X4XW69_9BACT|nr:anthranilate phosphoribosyltransferase [Desulfurella amilsii]OSS41758.1 Anthranilate phosphoribosyltransferase [Desulfurella amilsii]
MKKFSESLEFFDAMLSGKMSEKEIESALIKLAQEKEDPMDVAALAEVMLKNARLIEYHGECLDVVGSGGDDSNSFNISTAASIVSSLFVKVSKHGNRAVSSLSGAADILEALGVKIEQEKDKIVENLDNKNFAFLFAPFWHPKLKPIMPIRRKIAKRTIFNLIGPLCNPIKPAYKMIGVFSKDYLPLYFEAIEILDFQNVLLVSSDMDEVSLSDVTLCYQKKGMFTKRFEFDPRGFGIYATKDKLKGFDAKTNAKILKEVFLGEHEILADAIAINCAFAFSLSGIEDNLKDGFLLARESIKNKKAYEKLMEIAND